MFKEYVYGISLEESHTNRRTKGIQIKRKVEIVTKSGTSQLKEDLDHEYLYKYDPKKGEESTTAVGETQEARRALEVEANTNSEIETGLIAGIKTLLNTISITLQTRRESNQKDLSRQEASSTLLPIFRKEGWVPSTRTPLVLKEPWV